MRLERREIRENWGRMDHQDFQVSSIHPSIKYTVYGEEKRNWEKNNTRHTSSSSKNASYIIHDATRPQTVQSEICALCKEQLI